jgi:hypothetical protein
MGSMGTSMFQCDRCAEYFAGDSYRVTSAADGAIVLDMVVCYDCWVEASQLGLNTEPLEAQR